MLILTRKPGQKVLINNGSIQVKVLGVDDNIIITIGFFVLNNVDSEPTLNPINGEVIGILSPNCSPIID